MRRKQKRLRRLSILARVYLPKNRVVKASCPGLRKRRRGILTREAGNFRVRQHARVNGRKAVMIRSARPGTGRSVKICFSHAVRLLCRVLAPKRIIQSV